MSTSQLPELFMYYNKGKIFIAESSRNSKSESLGPMEIYCITKLTGEA